MKQMTLLVLLVALIFSPPPVLAQPSEEIQALRKAVDALRESQQRIEKELGEIKSLLRSRQAGAPDDEALAFYFAAQDRRALPLLYSEAAQDPQFQADNDAVQNDFAALDHEADRARKSSTSATLWLASPPFRT